MLLNPCASIKWEGFLEGENANTFRGDEAILDPETEGMSLAMAKRSGTRSFCGEESENKKGKRAKIEQEKARRFDETGQSYGPVMHCIITALPRIR